MYFQIENTPEHIRRARRSEFEAQDLPKEEYPRLELAPFCRPPQVVFENVLIGTTSERNLEVFNPSKQVQQITLGKALPPGLIIHIPGQWLQLEPETCYCMKLRWTPTQPTSVRETIRFVNENRGRFDVIVVLKSVMNIKTKGSQSKVFKISPGKVKKKTSKRSPIVLYKKKSEIVYNTTEIKNSYKCVLQQKITKNSNKENVSLKDHSNVFNSNKCPFDSPSSADLHFDISEIFSKQRKPDILQQTFEKSYVINNSLNVPHNVLKPSNKQPCDSVAELIDNLTFTPLKYAASKTEKLDVGPKIILSVNSESDFDDSLDMKNDDGKQNETHSIVSITSSQPPNKWLTINHHTQLDCQIETPTILVKKHPNTSSPKEFNSPNFSINTEFSRISDLSFYPQRFSTERKCFTKLNNETQELLDEPLKLCSDTYTKDSPNTPSEPNVHQINDTRPPHFFMKDQPKICRQALFKEHYIQKEICNQNNFLNPYEHVWQNDLRMDTRSPPRSITPPLQSIPEESVQFSDTQVLDKTDRFRNTFTIDQTFDKTRDHFTNRQSWSKKAVRAEPDLWKIPITHIKKTVKNKQSKSKDSIGGKISNTTFEMNKSNIQNMTINLIGNVYSQSSTIDPFVSSTYFYDEEAVDKFETEFKRWLNCILTPPADLDSNIEQTIDVGKAWIANRNKDVPIAPTKEQVSSAYHNSHRLERVRRSARALLISPEITQVFQKLSLQIEKKLIAVRTDRNLHLDVGLQKIIMELLLSYNPLWLRIGLEAIYGLSLPLKSNSDIEGLTSFIIQRMFKNPFLRNKHSKSNAPNMLLPAYMDAIKKFTLKKFFMLVYFLDQAKQRKLITHDPCLFCRNAVCKESREIIIRFTREVIAGIGDITKHLRPLGYVVSHKQSYLDEYKYAVHNLALDLRDGVRLTKVMEIILMKDGLLGQLRTPAISRLQKIHNVQVALNALKDVNFIIHGDITATDIADGHREKTLSLLWQIIHVFRAPLFEQAANIIQTWWRKKYEVIVQKRIEAEKNLQIRNNAASLIQCWWRRIQYDRWAEWKMQQVTTAVIIVQKYSRMWLCRTRLLKWKKSVSIIEEWYRSLKMMREAKMTLYNLRIEKHVLRTKSAIVIQSYVRRFLCMKMYATQLKKIIHVQSVIRRFLCRRKYMQYKQAVVSIQRKYKAKLLMKTEMHNYIKQRKYAIVIQSYIRMILYRRQYLKIKNSVRVIQERYKALLYMREERRKYLDVRQKAIKIQTLFRRYTCVEKYLKQRELIIHVQRRIKSYQLMKKQRCEFLTLRNAAVIIQKYTRAYLKMKHERQNYIILQKSTIIIQQHFRSYLLKKIQRKLFITLRNATVVLQKSYRNLILMRKERAVYVKLRSCCINIQRRYRAQVLMKKQREEYRQLIKATLTIQRKYKAQRNMRLQRTAYLEMKSSCIVIQRAYKAFVAGRRQRQDFLQKQQAAIKIQIWLRNCKQGKEIKQQFQLIKHSCVIIQRIYRAHTIGRKQKQEYIRIRTATVTIQRYYRSYIEMKIVRQQYIELRTATVIIQKYYRSHLEMREQRKFYLEMKNAALFVSRYYKCYRETRMLRNRYCQLRQASIQIQRWYRSICAMRVERNKFMKTITIVTFVQKKYKALLAMRNVRQSYLRLRQAAIIIQTRFRAYRLMKQTRINYIIKLRACRSIQRYYRSYVLRQRQRTEYLKLKQSAVVIQRRFRALVIMRMVRKTYLAIRAAAIIVQRRYRSRCLMLKVKETYIRMVNSCITIQRAFRAYTSGKRLRREYIKIQTAVKIIQTQYRLFKEKRKIQHEYQKLRTAVILVQRKYRANKTYRAIKLNVAARKIQIWYRATKKRNICRQEYLALRKTIILTQSIVRRRIIRKKFINIRNAALCIQKYYRNYKLMLVEKQRYIRIRDAVIKIQSYVRRYIARKRFCKLRSVALIIQTVYRFKREQKIKYLRERIAAICLQKYIRRYLIRSRYLQLKQKVTYIQRIWRGKLTTRLVRCEFLQKKNIIINIQSIIRGYLLRKNIQAKRAYIEKVREEKIRHYAASRIQALYRGHVVRVHVAHDKRITELRHRWRNGGLKSTQESMKERNEEAMEVLGTVSDIETIIKAFRSLELLTEVFPMRYKENALEIVQQVYAYMSTTNRSISSLELLKFAAAVLVNFARYSATGQDIYSRDHIQPILKFMLRFSKTETHVFCIMATYLWLFSKYENVKKDLTAFLNMPENHKILVNIKISVDKTKRMTTNILKNKFSTPKPCKFNSITKNQSLNLSVCTSNTSIILPTLEPDYGIVRVDKPRYFEDPQQAITCLFLTYRL